MPRYKVNISHVIAQEEARAMIGLAESQRDKFIVSILYLTGARPSELCLNKKTLDGLKREDFAIGEEYVTIKIKTAKLGARTKFRIDKRELEFPMTSPFMNYVLDWVKASSREELLPITTTRVRQIIYSLAKNTVCPYNFRHSRFVKMVRAGASVDEVMYFKGSTDLKSVGAYLKAKPIGRKLIID